MTDEELCTIRALGAKIQWEGGLMEAIEYGVDSEGVVDGILKGLIDRAVELNGLFLSVEVDLKNRLDELIPGWRD